MMKRFSSLLLLGLFLILLNPVFAADNIISDPVTYDTYQNELRESESSSKLSGKVWTDKSVVANKTNGKSTLNIDSKKIDFDDNFVEVYSALGSNSKIDGAAQTPVDLVIALDMSNSMAEPLEDKADPELKRNKAKIDETAETLNNLFEKITELSDKNKVSLVFFAEKAVTAIPLDNIKTSSGKPFIKVTKCVDKGFDQEIAVEISYTKSDGSSKTDEFSSTQLGSKTNFEAGYVESFKQFLNNQSGSQSSNKPKLIMLSDGAYTTCNKNCFTDNTSQLYLKDPPTSKSLIMETLMTCAYYKAKVNQVYSNPVEITSIVNSLSMKEGDQAKLDALNNKDNYLFSSKPVSDKDLEECRLAFQEWQQNHKVTLEILDYAPLTIGELPKDVTEQEFLNSVDFLDILEKVPFTEQSQVLKDVVNSFFTAEFKPVDDLMKNSLGETGTVSFHETIGDYMQVNLKKMILFGSMYDFQKVSSKNEESNQVDTYVPASTSGANAILTNNSYTNPVQFELNDIKVEVITKPDSNQELKIVVPDKALPIFKTLVDCSMNNNNGSEEVNSITDNRSSVNSLPIRFIYGVNLRPGIKNDDNTVNLESIDKEYLKKHQNGKEVEFFTTKYDEDSQSNTYNAESNFVPDTENPFYIAQEDFPIYEHFDIYRNSIDTPVNALGDLNSSGEYYIQKPYYYKSGSRNLKGENIEFISGQDLLNHPSSLKENEGSLILKNGNNCIGNLRNYQTNKVNNLTNTSDLRILPSIDTTQDRPEVVNYLGNNGKIALTVREIKLLITKYHSIGENLLTKDSLTVNARNIISYALEVNNPTFTDAYAVRVEDKVPEGLQVLSNSISNGGVLSNGTISWTIDVKANSTVTLKFQAFVIDNSIPTFENNFTIEYDTDNNTYQEKSNTVVAKLVYPELSIEKYQASEGEIPSTTDIKYMKGGDKVIQYQLKVTNKGTGPAKDLYIYDDVPSDFVIQNNTVSDNGAVSKNRVSWTLDHLEAGESKIVSFQVVIPKETPAKSWVNTSFVSHSTDPTPKPSNNVVIEKSEANLSITKRQSSASNPTPTYNQLVVNPGDTVTYYITVENNSDFEEKDITVTDPIPEGLTVESGSISNNGIFSDGKVVWVVGSIAPKSLVTLSFKTAVPKTQQANSWSNTAELDQPSLPTEFSNTVEITEPVQRPTTVTTDPTDPPDITNTVNLTDNNSNPVSTTDNSNTTRSTNNSNPTVTRNNPETPKEATKTTNPVTGVVSYPTNVLVMLGLASLVGCGLILIKRKNRS